MRWISAMIAGIVVGGCGSVRLAATEAQRQNAYAHWKICGLAHQAATQTQASAAVQRLTDLAARQSEAFVADYGLPTQLPAMDDTASALANAEPIMHQAMADAATAGDVWAVADALLDLGIGAAGVLGGALGLKLVTFLRQARDKAKALQEIVQGNELFKRRRPDAAADFKQAQAHQSPQTRQIVAQTKRNG